MIVGDPELNSGKIFLSLADNLLSFGACDNLRAIVVDVVALTAAYIKINRIDLLFQKSESPS
jgi:hypothetical protein